MNRVNYGIYLLYPFHCAGVAPAPIFISNMRPKLYGFHWGDFAHVDLFLLATLFFVYATHKDQKRLDFIEVMLKLAENTFFVSPATIVNT